MAFRSLRDSLTDGPGPEPSPLRGYNLLRVLLPPEMAAPQAALPSLLEFPPFDPNFFLGPRDTEVMDSLWVPNNCHQLPENPLWTPGLDRPE